MQTITKGLYYENIVQDINGKTQSIHITCYQQNNPDLTLLISKVSEAILPNEPTNHIGEGATLDKFMEKQNGVRFLTNGGFNHYRKNFYDWKHQDFNIGDPVGIVKIREHFFEDYVDLEHYGFLVQSEKGKPWSITKGITKGEKYILGCTPLLIFNGEKTHLPHELMTPVPNINPPSILGHGLQLHPRSAVGTKENELYFITVEGDTENFQGCTLPDLQEIGLSLELDAMLNLDGGGSSQFRLVDNGQIIKNNIHPDDQDRILGHALVIFDETLK